MITWQVNDIAVAVRSRKCGCGGHSVEERKCYRVAAVDLHADEVYLSVTKEDPHFYHHTLFRREQKATVDIFSLASAPVRKKQLDKVQ